MKDFLETGEFVTTHGIHGELRLYPWCDDVSFLTQFNTLYLDENGRQAIEITSLRRHKNICIVKLRCVDSVEAAHSYIGKTVYINRREAKLAPGEYFVQDLIGMRLCDADSGQEYGVITNVTRPARQDIYEVAMPNQGVALFPAVEPFLVRTEVETRTIFVRPIPGMFDEVQPPAKKRQKSGGGT